jgi:hypothetical protein
MEVPILTLILAAEQIFELFLELSGSPVFSAASKAFMVVP